MFKALLLGSVMALITVPAFAQTAAPAQPWLDASQSPEARADAAVAAMTQDEKLQLVFGYFSTDAPWENFKAPADGLPDSAGFVPGIARLGLPAQWQTDAGVGVATQRSPTPRLRTSLPSGMATAATWNPELAYQGGAMIGHEARFSGFNVMLAGGVNLARDPRNGRNFEYAGEDPLLAGTIDGNEIKGIQSNHIISTLKHYAFNDQSTSQSDLDVKIDDAAARTSDLLAFQIANEIGQPGSVMCSYNIVHGDYACESKWLLSDVLKTDWGFKGYVMTDWGATHSTVKAANSGLDQQSGWPFGKTRYFAEPLKAAIAAGQVPQARLDDMVHRILYAMFAHGLVDDPVAGDQSARIDYAADAAVSQADEEEAIVLLKNDGILPLARTAKKIVIIGGHADVGVLSGGGSSQVYPHGAPANGLILPNDGPDAFPGPMVYDPSSPMKGVQARTSASVVYDSGKDAGKAAKLAANADIAIVFATQWSAEGMDQKDLALPNHQDALIAAVARANPHTVVVLETGDPVTMPWLENVGAVIEAWFPGAGGGEAIARVLTGEVNPSGHLPLTFPASLDQLPHPVLAGGKGDTKHDGRYTADYDVEGAAVGYKWFDKKGYKPLFPFGYGLSYTQFTLSDLHPVDVTHDGLIVAVTLTNTGKVAGKDVAQIYVSGQGVSGANWEAPKRLGGFAKLDLAPAQSQTAQITIDPRLLATYNSTSKQWTVAPGSYTVTAGASAADTQASVQVTLGKLVFDVNGHYVSGQ
ncbi:glycoside hydrolase family 3 C-terminal domain-containing protein [Asticcacaulis sp. EMRT-3]|uniref:glycoside hydrolase family 3 C-terminal domain-containing protein n=1 Tax=Asticcacaulis sp. EMRT-3 TaxID=3040349 RepID=UPI0024AFB226|nr:glycoside hydrolase family 3 C-terminal domain-containing protein [Asticcacaulis sp. EMRT-3]MDI7776163.1 glycoside hydrolase family 3 C-terminal domain-containing protein [Asticcacaulis sp. EMRT-3]